MSTTTVFTDAETQKEATIQEEFLKYHKKNPWVYEGLVRLARQAKARGKTQLGIKMLVEVVRWEKYINSDSPKEVHMSNNFTSRYARLITEQEKELYGIFKMSTLRDGS